MIIRCVEVGLADEALTRLICFASASAKRAQAPSEEGAGTSFPVPFSSIRHLSESEER